MTSASISLTPAAPADYPAFKRELQAAFSEAVIAEYGALPNGPIPSDADLDQTMSAPNTVILRIVRDKDHVGGCVLTIDATSNENSLDLLFVKLGQHGAGIGRSAWHAIEARYPQTRVWRTITPYFEKRNIHFYVNRCGFKIVEFFNALHPDPHGMSANDFAGAEDLFRFEKIMTSERPARKFRQRGNS
ncbi:MAG: N-acetyltransferase [Proteobacteria bacterium]|nr:N-acetyltransferase [Pseudomonadota bacterium]